jgi:glyoxylate carboligase
MQQADKSKQIEAFSNIFKKIKYLNNEFVLDKIVELIFEIQDNLKINSEIENTLSK